jgi:hypothetical protein
MTKWLLLVLFVLGCAGEPFTGVEDESAISLAGAGLGSDGGDSQELVGSSGSASGDNPTPISGSGNNGGQASGGVAGEGSGGESGMAGGPELGNSWRCRTDTLCQCYRDPSLFEPGWLSEITCLESKLCTLRDNTACVCWDTEVAYQSALSNASPVDKCPPSN